MGRNRVTVRKRAFQQTKHRLDSVKGAEVGYLKGTTGGLQPYPDNAVTLASVASFHEFGTRRGLPPRPFLRPGVEAVKDEKRAIAKSIASVARGLTTGDAAGIVIGTIGKAKVQAHITKGGFTPLNPATIARKGSSKPLIDKGHLRAGVDARAKK